MSRTEGIGSSKLADDGGDVTEGQLKRLSLKFPMPEEVYSRTKRKEQIIRIHKEIKTMTKNRLLRMDNVGIVVESLDEAISFFAELGLKLEGRATIEGEWAGRVTGLGNQRVEIAMMVTPDGHSRLEISRFLTPPVVADHRNSPVNALGYLRVMFTVDDIDEMLARLRKRGAQLVGEVVQYEDSYRLCYIRGPEGLLIGLAEQLGNK
jgi:catechol 2,3-dioxygenase-like lactoylglutathione lyase family enzyme